MTILILIVSCALFILIHFVYVLVLRKGRFQENWPTLSCGLGTLFMVFFISIATTVLVPFQCVSSPNGQSTVVEYQAVVCFDSEKHTQMLIVAVVAFMLPLAYVSWCSWVVYCYPARMRTGQISFLRAN